MQRTGFLIFVLVCPVLALAQEAEEPLSAIDWLSQSVETAAAETGGVRDPVRDPNEAPVADSAATPEISVRPIDSADPDALGLLAGSVTGLPDTLWQTSRSDTLSTLIRAESVDTLPALRDLFTTLLLAQAAAPIPSGEDSFFLARVDRLLDLGALEPAQVLLELADRTDPDLFRRWFDVTLLTGTEDDACLFMEERPALAPTYPARIFCLARRGDWNAAALTLANARALSEITPEEDRLLTRFLDPEMDEGAEPLPPPTRPSPLVYRLREAIGEPLSGNGLPRAFAHADLRPIAPWRSQLEAAERLARAGAVTPNVLFALYTRETPAASGGLWDRARAIQRLETALVDGPDAVATALPAAWAAMAVPRAEVAFADYYADRIMAAGLTGEAAELAWQIALLSPRYEEVVLAMPPTNPAFAVLAAVARGDVAGVTPANDREAAVIAGFGNPATGATLADLLDQGRLGEALLRTLASMAAGLESDPLAVTEGLALLRRVGLEDVARRTALQYLILSRQT